MSKKLVCVASFFLVLTLAVSGQALVRTTADGKGADTYVSNDTQSGNYGPSSLHGSNTSIRVRYLADTRLKIGYLRFDVSRLTGDMNGVTLTMEASYQKGSAPKVLNVYGLTDEALDGWNEATICYDNAPGMLPPTPAPGKYAIDPNKLTLLGTITIPAAGAGTVCVSTTTDLPLDAFIASDTNGLVTLVLIDTANSEMEIATKENTNTALMRPSLVLPNAKVKPWQIIWVSDNKGYNQTNVTPPVEPNVAADHGFVDLLRAQGYDVIYKNEHEYIDGTQYWRTLDPNKIAELEAADLIILSRNADSGSYSTAADNEPNKWNAVTTPLLSLNFHMSRIAGKWGWINGTTTKEAKPPTLNVVDPSHPVFAGVTIDPNGQVASLNAQWNVDWVLGVTDAGNGKVLATRAGDGLLSIATWEAGKKFFEGGTAVAGGPRMLFVAGTGSKNTNPNFAPDGMYNLTSDGQKMFLNSVRYMLGIQASSVAVTNASFEQPGTTKQNCWDGGTNAKGTFVDVPGWNSDTLAQDSGVEQGQTPPDGAWSGFLMGTDPSVWNQTAYTIKAGDAFVLYVDAKDTWTTTKPGTLQATLFCLSAGQRLPLATKAFAVPSTWSTVMLAFNASESPSCVGLQIGIELKNASSATTDANSWLGIDNVRLMNLAGR